MTTSSNPEMLALALKSRGKTQAALAKASGAVQETAPP